MKIEQIRTQLTTLKLYMRKMEDWASQANQLIYETEERLMDLEDELHYKKYNDIQNFNEAATQIFSPARHEIDHCSKNHIAVVDFYQSEKII